MIYISIPNGMEYKQITNDKVPRDFFVDPHHKLPPIDLQELLKTALRENKGRNKIIPLKEFTIYTKVPPNTHELFLRYTPNNNGKYATTAAVAVIKGNASQKFQPQLHTRYGMFWDHAHSLSREKQKEILEKRKEQKHNRRHDGDCPKPT